jgi:GABA permease
VVPATPPHTGLTYTTARALSEAHDRLYAALEFFRKRGFEVTGEVGDPNPVDAVHDAIHSEEYDEIVLSTFPAGASRWLKMDLPRRLEKNFGVPVTHFVSPPPNAAVIPVGAQGFHTP